MVQPCSLKMVLTLLRNPNTKHLESVSLRSVVRCLIVNSMTRQMLSIMEVLNQCEQWQVSELAKRRLMPSAVLFQLLWSLTSIMRIQSIQVSLCFHNPQPMTIERTYCLQQEVLSLSHRMLIVMVSLSYMALVFGKTDVCQHQILNMLVPLKPCLILREAKWLTAQKFWKHSTQKVMSS